MVILQEIGVKVKLQKLRHLSKRRKMESEKARDLAHLVLSKNQ